MIRRTILLVLGLFILFPVVLDAQSSTRIGVGALVGWRTIDILDYPREDQSCCLFESGRGSGIGLGLNMVQYLGSSGSIRPMIFMDVSTFRSDDRWSERGDTLPFLSPTGEIGYQILEHRLQLQMQGVAITLGGGIEAGSFSLVPMLRCTFRTAASTNESLFLIEPENSQFYGYEDDTEYEYYDEGRGVFIRKIDPTHHTPLRIELGLSVGYHYGFDVLGAPIEIGFQAYGVTGLGSMYRRYTAHLITELGFRTVVSVQL